MSTSIPTTPDKAVGSPAVSSWYRAAKAAIDIVQAPPFCHAYNTAGLTLTSTSTWYVLPLDTEVSDVYGMHSTAGSLSRITPNIDVSCRLQIVCFARFASNSTGYRKGQLRANAGGSDTGGTGFGAFTRNAVNGDATSLDKTYSVPYTPGDYYEFFLWQNGTAGLMTETGANVTGMTVEVRSL